MVGMTALRTAWLGCPFFATNAQPGQKRCVRLRCISMPLCVRASKAEAAVDVVDEGWFAALRAELVVFRNKDLAAGGGKTLTLPASLSSRQRRRVHQLAEVLGLGHVSAGAGAERRLTVDKRDVEQRLQQLLELLDEEEAASNELAQLEASLPAGELEAAGLLLRKAVLNEIAAGAFGRERWVLGDGPGRERAGHVAVFSQRARAGSSVRLAVQGPKGEWLAAQGAPPARVAWARSGMLCIVFDAPPGQSQADDEEDDKKGGPSLSLEDLSKTGALVDLLLVPDSVTFDRMRSGIKDCLRAEGGLSVLLRVILGTGISSMFAPMHMPAPGSGDASPSTSPSEPQPGMSSVPNASPSSNGGAPQATTGFLDPNLNEGQRAAVALCCCLAAEEGISGGRGASSPQWVPPVALVHGPFGTGKTRTLVEIIRRRVATGERLLVLAASNTAVDNVAIALLGADPGLSLARVGLPERIHPALADHTLEALLQASPNMAIAAKLRREAAAAMNASKKWSRAADGWQKRKAARQEHNALMKDARKLEQSATSDVLRDIRVVCGTLTGFATGLQQGKGASKGQGGEDRDGLLFDAAVVDEASQAATPAMLLALPYLRYPAGWDGEAARESLVQARDEFFLRDHAPSRPLLVLAGDHRQLPPTVLADSGEDGGGLSQTVFEELMERDSGGNLAADMMSPLMSAAEQQKEMARILAHASAMASAQPPPTLDTAAASITAKATTTTTDAPAASMAAYGRGGISVALREQYRMPRELMAFPSAAFYSSRLISRVPSVGRGMLGAADGADAGDAILRDGCRLEVFDTSGAGYDESRGIASAGDGGKKEAAGGKAASISVSNREEAELAARVVREVVARVQGAGSASAAGSSTPLGSAFSLEVSSSNACATIGVVTPYSAQAALLRQLLKDELAQGLEIDTVDSFQGREKEVIILDCVRSNDAGDIGFLADYRRLNVALTRARSKLVIIGDSATLGRDTLWATLFEWSSAVVTQDGLPAYRSVFELPPKGGW
eukprot:jgi/Mesvir1/28032/Mv04638-RA.1